MLTINFYRKTTTPNKKGKVPVVAQISYDYRKYRKSIGAVVSAHWNDKTQRLKVSASTGEDTKDYIRFNSLLDDLSSRVKEYYNRLILEKRKATEQEIRQLLSLESDETIQGEVDFFETFEKYITGQKAFLASNTIKSIVTVKNYLMKFQRETGFKVTFGSIDSRFSDKLMDYSFITRKIDNDYFAKHASVLKQFLRWSGKRGYFQGTIPEELYAIKEKENEVIFLTMEELKILTEFDFKIERLSRVRDKFCFACYTGLRHCDVASLVWENIVDGSIRKSHNKTQNFVYTPLNKQALKILEKNKNEPMPLPVISSQKTNKYLQECCKLIAQDQEADKLFNRRILRKRAIGREIEQKAIPLYDAITFHVGRKTFITNSLMLGVNLQVLQEMGAPKKQKDLKKYLKITDAYKNQVMKDTWDRVS